MPNRIALDKTTNSLVSDYKSTFGRSRNQKFGSIGPENNKKSATIFSAGKTMARNGSTIITGKSEMLDFGYHTPNNKIKFDIYTPVPAYYPRNTDYTGFIPL